MRKKLFNHHKLAKKWKRNAAPVLLRSHETIKSTKDFAWHRSKLNPYYNKESSRKRRVELYVLVVSVLAMLCVVVYHPFFSITDIDVRGTERLKKDDIHSAVLGMIDYHKAFIFPASSYFLVNVDDIGSILKSKFPLETVTVTKTFPHHLSVEIKEKISTIIYDNGKTYSYLGLDGNVVDIMRKVGDDEWKTGSVSQTTTSTILNTTSTQQKIIANIHVPPIKSIKSELGDYPIVYDMEGKEGNVNDQVLSHDQVASVIAWFTFLKEKTDIPFGYMTIEDATGNALIKTQENWDIKIKLGSDAASQMNLLTTGLKSNMNRKNLQYVDLRYPGRIYWQ